MSLSTTESQVELMKQISEELASEDLVRTAYLDDWGRFGNFSLIVEPKHPDRFSTNRLKALVNRKLEEETEGAAHLRDCFGPDPIYESDFEGNRRVVGYKSNEWVFDIDFNVYNSILNSFN